MLLSAEDLLAVPLVYTTKGNLPASELEYSVRWEDTPDYTKFVETYKLAGEVVKESAHVMSKIGISSDAVQQSF